jgi:tetratricopeptide (TPR) repeat protein
MKRILLATVSVGAVVGLGLYVGCSKAPATSSAEPTAQESVAESTPTHLSQPAPNRVESLLAAEQASAVAPEQSSPIFEQSKIPAPTSTPAPIAPSAKLVFDQAIETVLSPQSSYEQKQTAWKQLKKAGRLENAITDLEQRVAANPQSVESVAALGQAYYKKAGDTEDVRESAILAMKADQTLEAALNLDPQNWDARFMRAVGMTYWPLELNKTKDVIEQFQILIQQQESQAPQSQFAKTYIKLGEYYEKAGDPKYAATIWQRGAALFPADSDLKEKLATVK